MYNENFIGVHHDDPKYTEQNDKKMQLSGILLSGNTAQNGQLNENWRQIDYSNKLSANHHDLSQLPKVIFVATFS